MLPLILKQNLPKHRPVVILSEGIHKLAFDSMNRTQKDELIETLKQMHIIQKEKEDDMRRLEAELKARQVSLDAKQTECAQKQEQLQSVQIETQRVKYTQKYISNEQYLLEKEGLKLTCSDKMYERERKDERYSAVD
eukprot:329406_1